MYTRAPVATTKKLQSYRLLRMPQPQDILLYSHQDYYQPEGGNVVKLSDRRTCREPTRMVPHAVHRRRRRLTCISRIVSLFLC